MSEQFIDKVSEYLHTIVNIKDSILCLIGEAFLQNHQKTLLFSLLDSMSRGVYGERFSNNSTRFEAFILEFCSWSDANRISLQQLALLLDETGQEEFIELKEFTLSELAKYPMSRPVPFRFDLEYDEILQFMPNGSSKIKGIEISYLKHVKLLYKYRNSLVHEARGLGANPLFEKNEPHYIHYTKLDRASDGNAVKTENWEISYPLSFFIMLVDNAILNIKPYLVENEIAPFNNYDFKSLWVKVR